MESTCAAGKTQRQLNFPRCCSLKAALLCDPEHVLHSGISKMQPRFLAFGLNVELRCGVFYSFDL